MGSLFKKVKKNSDKFNKALAALEKQFALLQEEQEASGEIPKDTSFQKFDLANVIESEIKNKEELKRKARNKRKAERKKRSK